MSKKTGKSLEELIQEALIPRKDHPYKVPDNWVWTRFDTVVKPANNTSKSVPQKYYEEFGLLPVIDQGKKYIAGYTNNIELKYSGKLPIIVFGDHTKCIKWIDFDFAQGADGTKLLKPLVNERYIYYLLQYANIPNKGYSRHYKFLRELKLPLAPLNEQKRIADKVEFLLNKINQAKQLIGEAKETFELRRAAILDKAFRGELTVKWREENMTKLSSDRNANNKFPIGWEITYFKSIAAEEKYSLAIGPFGSNLKVTDYRTNGIPLIFVRNIRSSDYSLDCKYVSEEKAKELKAHTVKAGDILITKMGDPPGDSDICPQFIDEAVITADCIKLRVNVNIVNNKFLMYAIRSNYVQIQIKTASKGVAQQKISLKLFKEMNVMLPPIEEQLEIVSLLEKLLTIEDEVLDSIKNVEERLETLEQSILSKSFRGELGTNEPTKESAMNLLEEILKNESK